MCFGSWIKNCHRGVHGAETIPQAPASTYILHCFAFTTFIWLPSIYLFNAHKWRAGGKLCINIFSIIYALLLCVHAFDWCPMFIMPRWLREKINLYFDANDIRIDSKGIVLFVISLCVEERWNFFFLIVARNKFSTLQISHANFRTNFVSNTHNWYQPEGVLKMSKKIDASKVQCGLLH